MKVRVEHDKSLLSARVREAQLAHLRKALRNSGRWEAVKTGWNHQVVRRIFPSDLELLYKMSTQQVAALPEFKVNFDWSTATNRDPDSGFMMYYGWAWRETNLPTPRSNLPTINVKAFDTTLNTFRWMLSGTVLWSYARAVRRNWTCVVMC